MNEQISKRRQDALAIWHAALAAVKSDKLVEDAVQVDGDLLTIAEDSFELAEIKRIIVVGAGKAGAGMVRGLENKLSAGLGEKLASEKSITGWVNVPAGCVEPTKWINLHAGRPAGVNEPRPEGVEGTNRILELVRSATPQDLVIGLISGGGSALLPAPADGITLADKLAVTQRLSGSGANIEQLNTVRKHLSKIKGGKLAAACQAQMCVLIVSDVLGDPLDLIASGPTVPDTSTAAEALNILESFGGEQAFPASVMQRLKQKSNLAVDVQSFEHVSNTIIGNNAVAVDAAGIQADKLGYRFAMTSASKSEGEAEVVGRHLAQMALHTLREGGPPVLISGGEPIVKLPPADRRGKGGRNQQLVLAALQSLLDQLEGEEASLLDSICLVSAGTDGEDGPTDAAGGFIDGDILRAIRSKNLSIDEALSRCDAYTLLKQVDGLVMTGPTHTNVCDVRVLIVGENP